MSPQVTAQAPSFALPQAPAEQASTAVAIYRPQAGMIAERLRDIDATMGKPLGELVVTKKDPKVLTDSWGLPLLAGVVAAIGTMFIAEGMLIPASLLGLGVLGTTVAGIAHRFIKRRAIEDAPPLLQGDLREKVLRLAEARASFEPAEGGRLEAKEVDAFVAKRAQALLASAKREHHGTNDTDLIALLERYASISTKLTPDEEALLTFVDACLQAAKQHYSNTKIPELFSALTDAQKVELAPFVRDLVFDVDRPKVQSDLRSFLGLHAQLEAIEKRTKVDYPTTPTTIPAAVADTKDSAATLRNLAEFQRRADFTGALRSRRTPTLAPEVIKYAVEFAVADERTGVERALIGMMAQQAIGALDYYGDFALRLRSSLNDLIATGAAEPQAVRDTATRLLKRVENIIAGFAKDTNYTTEESILRVVDIIELTRG